MKRLKRSLSLWLAVALIVSALYVPAFGSETADGKQDSAAEVTEEAARQDLDGGKDEEDALIDAGGEESSEDQKQEDPAAIADDSEPTDVDDENAAIDVDENAAIDVDEAEEEAADAAEDTAKEETEAAGPESVEEDVAAEPDQEVDRSSAAGALRAGSTYEVIFYANGGTFSDGTTVKTMRLPAGTEIDDEVIDPPVIDDYTKAFAGWDHFGHTPHLHTTVNQDMDLYAIWDTTHVITLHDSQGRFKEEYWQEDPETGVIRNAQTYTLRVLDGTNFYWNEQEELLDPGEGMAFTGWSTVEGGETFLGEGIDIYEDTDLYATWELNYTITFDANGGYFESYEYDEEAGQSIPYHHDTVTRDFLKGDVIHNDDDWDKPYLDGSMKNFIGWSTTPDGDPLGDEGYTVNSSATLYAVWYEEKVNATFNAGSGYFKVGDEITTELERSIVVNATLDGSIKDLLYNDDPNMVFKGWSEEPDGEIVDDSYLFDSDVTLYAVWACEFTVTFKANGGYFGNDPGHPDTFEEICDGETWYSKDYDLGLENDDPSMTFVGWGADPNGGLYSDGFIASESITVYALWGRTCTVTYNANGGYFERAQGHVETVEAQVLSGDTVYADAYNTDYRPENDDPLLKFQGWSTNSDADYSEDTILVEDDITLYAVWREEIIITTDANGGYFYSPEDGLTVMDYHYVPGEWIIPLYFTAPENSDETLAFVGWSKEKDGELFQDGEEVYSDMTLYAVWEKGLTVTFDANGGTFGDGGQTRTEKVTDGQFIYTYYGDDHPVYANDSKGFAGWSTSKNGNPVNPGIIVNKNTTFYAVWKNNCTITYHAGEGRFVEYYWDEETQDSVPVYSDTYQGKALEGESLYYRAEYGRLEKPENKEFVGWSWTAGGELLSENDEENKITKDTHLYAVYKPLYTVTMHATEGKFVEEEWDPETGESIPVYRDTLTATYTEGESFGDSDCSSYLAEMDGRRFAGWSLTEGGKPFIDEITITGDTEVFATWTNLYTITFDPNGGFFREWGYDPETGEDILEKVYEHTDQYVEGEILDNFAGYTPYYEDESQKIFAGWSTSKNGDPIGEAGYEVKGPATLYAVWEKPVAVTFDANGGLITEYYEEDTGRWITGVSLSSWTRYLNRGSAVGRRDYNGFSNPDKEGMVFLGWGTSKDGNLIGNEDLVVDQDITLYAQWGEPCTITYHANGGFFADFDPEIGNVIKYETTQVDYGVGYIISNHNYSPEYYKEGCIFGGWSLTKDGVPFGSEGYAVKGGETLYAVWRKLGWNQIGSGWKYAVADENDNISYYANRWALIDGKWYYFDKDEWMATGWRNVGGEWYYLKANGAMAANEWAKDSTGWCWMDASGKITKNKWIQSGGEWYFLKANGYMAANEWAKDSGGWYWMDGSGKITKNKWIQSGGEWYFLKANGYMAHSEWAQDSGGWYWMGSNGRITRNKWVIIRVNWYFFKADGHMARNEWAKDSGGWYWMDSSGKITKNKWIQSGGKWYYLGANGYMVTGTQRIGGKTYRFNSSGAWIQ